MTDGYILLIYVPFLSYKDYGKYKAALIVGTVAAGTFVLVLAVALAVLAEKVGEINAEENTRKKSYVTEDDKGVCDKEDTKC